MVETGELPVKFRRGDVIGHGGLYGGHKSTQKNVLFVQPNSCNELLPSFNIGKKYHALKTARIIRTLFPISRILGASSQSKIFSSIIKTIPVNVINFTRWEPHNKTVHGYFFTALSALWNVCLRIKIFTGTALVGVPLKTGNNIVVGFVDSCRLVPGKFNCDHFSILSFFVKTNKGENNGYGY